ncbi:hypothetical protein ARMGADRAFT_481593 [Armillaria gallica]|uniref:Uncharacterized protein n=1 Tax=Armillaria gallica TaxID=47427 RepID=A0A2H3DXS4_ARMGA|nr:hypothetical protein ARMGADRAFT_185610 [Armillaria gallica]PBK98860.1 hypothetical protein ARMGADRAFT_481593 [Armillaria gallica]
MRVNTHELLSPESICHRRRARGWKGRRTASTENVLGIANSYPRALQPLYSCHQIHHKTSPPERHRLSPSCFRSQSSVCVLLSRRKKTFDSSHRSDLSSAIEGRMRTI